MSNKQYRLKKLWQSRSGLQEVLYLSFKNNRIDCTNIKEDALVMTKEDAESWLIILPRGKSAWSMEQIEIKEEQNVTQEEQPNEIHNEQ